MNIHLAKPSQAQEINNLTLEAFTQYKEQLNDAVTVKALNETIEDVIFDINNNTVFVAQRDNKIIGSIRIEKLNNELAYIYRFSVTPKESGAGVGSQLISFAIEACREMGVKAITLHTNTKYYKLARYYYGKGFFVHSTTFDKGYIRALFVKELAVDAYDISAALEK